MVSKKQIAEMENVIGTMALGELIAMRDGLNERISEIQEKEKEKTSEALRVQYNEMMAKAQQLGLNLGNVLGISPPARRNTSRTPNENGDGRSKAETQVRNPKNHAESWSLRGMKPSWLIRELAMRGIDGSKIKNNDIPAEFWVKNQ